MRRLAPSPTNRSELRGVARGARRWALVVVVVALTASLRLPAFFVDVFNSDETFLATQAQVIRDGGSLYEDATDRKPPLVPYLYAATFALVGSTALWSRAGGRDVRGRDHRAAARGGGPPAVRRTGRVVGGAAVRRRVGRVRAPGRAGGELRGVHAAGDDRGGAARRARSPRGAGFAVALATLAKQTGAATLLPVLYLVVAHARSAGRRGARSVGFAIPLAVVALLVGPGDLVFWAVAGNGSYFGLGSATRVRRRAVRGDDVRVRRVQPADRVDGPDRVAGAVSAGQDTDLWLWLLSAALSVAVGFRFFGHYYLQLLPPLVPDQRRGALPSCRRIAPGSRWPFALVAGVGFAVVGFVARPWGDEPKYRTGERVSRDASSAPTRPGLRVGSHARDLLGVGRATRDPVPVERVRQRRLGRPSRRGTRRADVPTPGARDRC